MQIFNKYNMPNQRFPDFLIIGAMKAGTTTLWSTLKSNPHIFFPNEKEPGNLTSDKIFSITEKKKYAKLFSDAHPQQLCGEASTYYTMMPEKKGVPERAKEICGEGLKVIYIVRNPLRRIISHHRHSVYASDMDPDINKAILEDSRLINYSKYAMQLEPWINTFGYDNVFLVRFESFIKDPKIVDNLLSFLSISDTFNKAAEIEIKNSHYDLKRFGIITKSVVRSDFYKQFVRPVLPNCIRDKISNSLNKGLPKNYNGNPSKKTLSLIKESVVDDCEFLGRIMNMDTLWDFELTEQQILNRQKSNVLQSTG